VRREDATGARGRDPRDLRVSPPQPPRRFSAEIDDDHAAIRIGLVIVHRPLRATWLERQLETRLLLVSTRSVLFFSLSNLLDDEGGEHGTSLG
jgi:hypothetical protein